ncbi:hypothetical protein [Actinocrispum wychmicini]|uniref:Uncharacterized protein n=1 Tax=Actinocrispum wychmicini TaxID=1213861 RepID=A0A4V2S485_9PSEU|nr:hypothetical protein [Actinocrispum wychmicini]TCO47290.1 hypothetical protein EV192_11730 [Actinocrispum wychmicini]
MDPIDPATANAALWFYAMVFTGWFSSAAGRGFVRLYTYLDTLPSRKDKDSMPTTDTRNRALRTLAQNLAFDALLAVILVLLPAIQAEHINWSLLLASIAKTAAVTILAGTQRWLENRRSDPA